MASTLRSLLTIVSIFYCISVAVMLLNLPAIRHQLSRKIGQSTDPEGTPPVIHPHILRRRVAEERCLNLTHHHRTSPRLIFSSIPGSEISILSAYHDRRLPDRPYIRLLVLMPLRPHPNLHCHLLVGERDFRAHATLYQFNENHGMQFGGYIFSCPLPPRLASDTPICTVRVTDGANVTDRGVEVFLDSVPRADTPVRNLTTCVPPLFGQIDARRLVEFVELHRLLGVEHFYFYDFSRMKGDAEKVFRHYIERGLVTRRVWTLPINEHAIWYKGQMLAVHHCLYANMGLSRFTTFNDLDEAFVPRNHPDLPSLLTEIDAGQHHCGFRFFSAFFPSRSTPNDLLSLRTHRTKSVSRVRTKCIVHPDLIFEMGIHHISKQNVEEKTPHNVDPKKLILHHFRHCDRSYGMNCEQFMDDNTIPRVFGERLQKRYLHTLTRVLPSFDL